MKFLNFIKNKLIIKKRISHLLLLFLILSSIFIVKIATAEVSNNKELNILEIQPGDNFIIKGSKGLYTTGIDTKNIQGYNVNIEHISMSEFIGRIDRLNGKYDVIVIGRNYNNKNNDRDYSGINDDGNEKDGGINWGEADILPTGHYAENDITNKKMKEIKEFIDSGQLVYFNTKILEVDNSNLKRYFENETSNNVIKYSNDGDVELSKIVETYSKAEEGNLLDEKNEKININIRPRITVTCSEGDSDKDEYGNIDNREMRFSINIPEDTDRYTVKLFLDINGDGIFSEKECYERRKNIISQDNYNISHNLGSDFIGWLQWKVQIEKGQDESKSIKSYVTGSILFRRLEGQPKKVIKVLQIYPNNDGLDLTSSSFENAIKNNPDKPIDKKNVLLDDYNIIIDKITAEDFNNSSVKLNGMYNMVIIGFFDGYGGKDITNSKALDELQSFIKSGQSIMFTHDTMALRVGVSGSTNLTKRFRDFIGQSRFLDKFVEKDTIFDENNPNYIYTADAYDEYDSLEGIYKQRNIPHIKLKSSSKEMVGYALNGRRGIKYDIAKVYKTNSALINNYPYKLNDTITVAPTHVQWYQLNLEDPDVVPWYTLQDNTLNKYDSRNNYYTYSKGNITYSGTGHSDKYRYGEEEFQLFVNTIVKAERGANHAPIITCSIPKESDSNNTEINEVNYAQNYYFTLNASDYENDIVKMNLSIDGIDISQDNIISDGVELTSYTDKNQQQYKVFDIITSDLDREDIRIKIPTEKLREALNKDINLKIEIKAWDTLGALSMKTYLLKPVRSQAAIDVQFISATPSTSKYGESVTVKYEVTPNDYYYNNNIANGSKIDEAIFLVDLSSTMNSGQRLTQIKSNITEVINDSELKNIKLGVIGFNEVSFVGSRNYENEPKSSIITQTDGNVSNLKKPLYGIDDANEKDGFRQFFQNDLLKIGTNTTRNLDTALKTADNVFNTFGQIRNKKAIIIISSGNLNYTDTEINRIKNKGYKIITLDISGDAGSNISNVHDKLGGISNDLIISKSDGGNFNFVNSDMKGVAERLKSGITTDTKIITSANFNFNLGDYFEPETNSSIVNVGGNKYKIDVTDKINYIKTDERNTNGEIKYTAEHFEVQFRIKLKDKQYKGNLGFNTKTYNDQQYNYEQLINGADIDNDSNFEYKDINNSEITQLTIKTPVIKIKKDEIDIKHGVYNSISQEDGVKISDGEQRFPGGSTVPLGAYITGSENNQKIKITIPENIDYRIDKICYISNNYEIIGEMQISDNKILEYTISNLPQECNRILVLYHETLPLNKISFENNIEVIDENVYKSVKINVSIDAMPDIF